MARSAATRPSLPARLADPARAPASRACRVLPSPRVTRLAMNLTDGTPVDFASCHDLRPPLLERHEGVELDRHRRARARTRKPAHPLARSDVGR